MNYKLINYNVLTTYSLRRYTEKSLLNAYTFDCTFFRLTCLTAKALRRITMCAFLVGAIEPKKCTLKRIQPRFLG